jgi:hypothetical protein
MADALFILVAIATVVGVFFLVVFSLLARREHRSKTTKRHASRKEIDDVCGARGARMTSDEVLSRLQGSQTDLGRFVKAMLRNQQPHLIVPANAVRAWQEREPRSWEMVCDWLAEQGKSVVLI